MITEDKLGKALTYLAETDETCAKAKSLMKGLEYRLKTNKAIAFLDAEGAQGVRENIAYQDTRFTDTVGRYENAVADYETMANKRKTAELIVEVWRSVNSARSRGIIT